VARGPHQSSRSTEALTHFATESAEKVKVGQARLVLWDNIKASPTEDFTSTVASRSENSVIAKVRHAFTALPGGRGLLSLCNRLLNRRPPVVYFHHNNSLHLAISNCQTILRESTSRPTRCRELVAGWPDFIGVVDASSHGVRGRGCIDKKIKKNCPKLKFEVGNL
jgi:hypothetical protein